MSITCHFRDCKALAAGHESESCKRRYSKCLDLYLYLYLWNVWAWWNGYTLVRVVPARPTATCSHSSYVFISDRHRVRCTTGLCSWPYPLFAIRRCSTVADWRLWSSSSSLCRRHSDLRVLLTNAVLVRGTTEPYFWVYRCCFQLDAITHNAAKTEITWLITGRRSHMLPQQLLQVGCDLIMPVLVVRDLGIHIDADVSMRSHVMKTTPLCFAVSHQLRGIHRSVPSTVFHQSLVSCLVLPRLDYCNPLLAGIPLHLTRRLQSVMNAATQSAITQRRCYTGWNFQGG